MRIVMTAAGQECRIRELVDLLRTLELKANGSIYLEDRDLWPSVLERHGRPLVLPLIGALELLKDTNDRESIADELERMGRRAFWLANEQRRRRGGGVS